jgi:mannose-1-phosphate guanylyltransferase
MEKGVNGMILAAGFGTRLRPLTEELPKPLVWLGDRPLLAHVAERLAAAGIRRAVVNTHHLASAFHPDLLARLPIAIDLVHEPVLLGTAGGLANARERLGPGDVVVWNGDILADVDLGALVEAHRHSVHRSGVATLAVAPRPTGQGTVGLDRHGDIVRLRGERFGEEARGGDFIGVQVAGEALRRRLAPVTSCLVNDAYMPILQEGGRICSFTTNGPWDDLGTIAAYLKAHACWLQGLGKTEFIGAGSRIAEGVDITESVIGEGAVVTGRGGLNRCVLWPHARAEAPLQDAVVTASGRIARAG